MMMTSLRSRDINDVNEVTQGFDWNVIESFDSKI